VKKDICVCALTGLPLIKVCPACNVSYGICEKCSSQHPHPLCDPNPDVQFFYKLIEEQSLDCSNSLLLPKLQDLQKDPSHLKQSLEDYCANLATKVSFAHSAIEDSLHKIKDACHTLLHL